MVEQLTYIQPVVGSSPTGRTKMKMMGMLPVIFIFSSGLEQERGRENTCFPAEEGMGKPWVSQE